MKENDKGNDIESDDNRLSGEERSVLGLMMYFLIAAFVSFLAFFFSGCATYDGGKVVDGTNIIIGIHVPGTDWNISVLDYVGGVKVGGDEDTSVEVTHEVVETNDYFGVVHIRRHSRLKTKIVPYADPAALTNAAPCLLDSPDAGGTNAAPKRWLCPYSDGRAVVPCVIEVKPAQENVRPSAEPAQLLDCASSPAEPAASPSK